MHVGTDCGWRGADCLAAKTVGLAEGECGGA